jgi:hypothetical protein
MWNGGELLHDSSKHHGSMQHRRLKPFEHNRAAPPCQASCGYARLGAHEASQEDMETTGSIVAS